MKTYFDTSAIVPLLLQEPHTQAALEVWSQSSQCYAWLWLEVETEAALQRRAAPASAWKNWERIRSSINFLTFPDSEIPALRFLNRSLGLRAADAGHLFVMEKLSRVEPIIRLACFDIEMLKSASTLQLLTTENLAGNEP